MGWRWPSDARTHSIRKTLPSGPLSEDNLGEERLGKRKSSNPKNTCASRLLGLGTSMEHNDLIKLAICLHEKRKQDPIPCDAGHASCPRRRLTLAGPSGVRMYLDGQFAATALTHFLIQFCRQSAGGDWRLCNMHTTEATR